jgi:uncharacterized protein
MVALIDAYRYLLSPWIGQHCRFDPTCSRYAREAIILHGPLRGPWLAMLRLLKCHPWHPGGCDPVPGREPQGHIPANSCSESVH